MILVGSVSVNDSPPCAGLLILLVIVNVSTEGALSGIEAGANPLVSVVPLTVKVSLTPPASKPPTSAEILALVLLYTPDVGLVMLMVTVQDALAVKSTPDTVMVFIPAVAVRASAAPVVSVQVPPKVAGVATITPAGSVSVKPISTVAVALLVIVNVSFAG